MRVAVQINVVLGTLNGVLQKGYLVCCVCLCASKFIGKLLLLYSFLSYLCHLCMLEHYISYIPCVREFSFIFPRGIQRMVKRGLIYMQNLLGDKKKTFLDFMGLLIFTCMQARMDRTLSDFWKGKKEFRLYPVINVFINTVFAVESLVCRQCDIWVLLHKL